jgi:hypothetical protein
MTHGGDVNSPRCKKENGIQLDAVFFMQLFRYANANGGLGGSTGCGASGGKRL